MKILFLGNSKFFNSRIRKSLDRTPKFRYIIASRSNKNDKDVKFSNYLTALKKERYDVVYISLINKLHFKYCKIALQLKKNVIVDKPLSLSEKNYKKLISIAKKNNVLLAESVIFNYHKMFDYIYNYTNKLKLISKIDVFFNIPSKLSYEEFKNKKLDCLSDMSSYAASIHRLFFNDKILKKNIYFVKNKKKNFIEKFNLNIVYNNDKFFNGYFAYGSEYISSIKFFCNKFILEIPFQAFAMRNDYYNLIIKKNNIIIKKKFKDDTILNFFQIIKKYLKNKNYNIFYNKLEEDLRFKKELTLFNE